MTDPTGRDDWRSGVDHQVAQQIRQLADRAREVDGVAPLSGHLLDALAAGTGNDHDGDDEFLLLAEGDRLVGVAVRRPGDPAELVVHPDCRGRGLGRRLVAAVVDSVGRVWAHGDLPAARALASGAGLTVARTLLQLRRPLTAGEPEPSLPQGISIRTFVPGQDEQQFLGVNARAFAWHPEQGRLDAAGLATELAQDWFDPAGFFLAVDDDDRVLGFHWTKVHRTDPTPLAGGGGAAHGADRAGSAIGEVYVLAVDPESTVRGLGGPLTAAGLHHLAQQGLPTVMLYVEGDNDRALSLYRRFGFVTAVTDVVYAGPDLP